MCFPDPQTLEDTNVKQSKSLPLNGKGMYPQQADSNKSQLQQKLFET